MISFEWDATRAKEVAHEEGRVEGRIEERVELTNEFVLSLLKNKAPMHFITDATHLSAEEVAQIAQKHGLAI